MQGNVWTILQNIFLIGLAVAVILQAIKVIFKLKQKELRKVKRVKKGKLEIEKMEHKTHWILRLFPVFAIFLGALLGFLYFNFEVKGIVDGIAGGGISSWIFSLVKKTLKGK